MPHFCSRLLSFTGLAFFLAAPSLASDAHDTAAAAFGHAPIGVMGDHRHQKGEWMISLRSMRMHMDGNRDGSSRVAASEITGTMMNPGEYVVAPLEMDMDMQMLGLMYAPSDEVTLALMIPQVRLEMDHVTRMGREFTTVAEGLGDVKINALVALPSNGGVAAHWSVGLSVPTGSINNRDDTPAMQNAKLPYSMQIGSGTYDFLAGLTVQRYEGAYNTGFQVNATVRVGENSNNYRLGNVLDSSVWVARALGDRLSVSARLQGRIIGNLSGSRDDLNPNMIQTADPDNQAGRKLSAGLGANYRVLAGAMKGHRFALEWLAPVYQDLQGPQLETDWEVTAGWQLGF